MKRGIIKSIFFQFFPIAIFFIAQISFAGINKNHAIIHLITTNDLHGQIIGQKATFMNPEYPPDILDASAMYHYVTELRKEVESKNEGVLVIDGGNFFQGHPFGMADSGKTMIEP